MLAMMILCLIICISYVAYDNAFKTTYLYTISSSILNESACSTKKDVLLKDCYLEGFADPKPELCPMLGENLKVMAMVTSAPSHFDKRLAIRQSWGFVATRKDIKIAFLIGQTNETEYEALLQTEEEVFSDVIRANFNDSYYNLTFKTVSMMQWMLNYCPYARFVLKVDDDVFVNVNNLISFVDKQVDLQNVIFGNVVFDWKPIRSNISKFFVTNDEYDLTLYPAFALGPAYLLPTSLAGPLYTAALNTPFLKLEDVFLTGIVAQELNITRVYSPQFGNSRTLKNECNANQLISINNVTVSEHLKLYTYLNGNNTNCYFHI